MCSRVSYSTLGMKIESIIDQKHIRLEKRIVLVEDYKKPLLSYLNNQRFWFFWSKCFDSSLKDFLWSITAELSTSDRWKRVGQFVLNVRLIPMKLFSLSELLSGKVDIWDYWGREHFEKKSLLKLFNGKQKIWKPTPVWTKR